MENYGEAYCRNLFVNRLVDEEAKKNREMNEKLDIPDSGVSLRDMSLVETNVAFLNRMEMFEGKSHTVTSTPEEALIDLGIDPSEFNRNKK